MTIRLLLPALLLAALQTSPDTQIMSEIKDHGKAAEDLAYLSDVIGPRLTGSESLGKAQDWVAGKMREYGAENVHFESYDYPSRWVRGHDDYAQLLTQSGRQMEVHAMPWNPATKGRIKADLALLTGPVEELLKNVDRFKGKIVVLGPIAPTKDEKESAQLIRKLYKEIGTRSVALLGSFEHGDGKFTMYGSPDDAYFDDYFDGWPRLPFGFLIAEDRSMLARLLRKGETVRMELRLGGAITKRNIKERNVVGEIRGTERPDEVVLIGGHLDSWDLGTGTTDNGTGSIATLESLRVMKKLGLRPKRTIRFVLFSGEEQGSYGAKAYVQAHKAELPNLQAVLIHDLGAGKPSGFTIQGYTEWIPALTKVLAPLEGIGANHIPIERHWDSDQDPFVVEGVPGFFLDQDTTDYFASTHHSQTDMLNHVKPDEYLPSIQAFTVAAWGFANLPERVPHVPRGQMVGPGKDK
jgi:carboxypeptidase Q